MYRIGQKIVSCRLRDSACWRSGEITQEQLFLANSVQGVPCPRGLGFVDLDLGSSPSWWAAIVATYCQSRMLQHPKSKS